MAIKRNLFAVLIVASLAAAALVWYFLAGLDARVARAIENAGSEAFQVDVDVSGVSVALGDGRVTIDRLTIGNPEGFSSANAVELGGIDLRIALNSLRQPVLQVAELSVKEPSVRLEMKPDGSSNLATLRDTLEGTMGDSGAGEPTLLVVDRLDISEIPVHATVETPSGEEEREFTLAAISMRDVGGNQGGLTAEQLASVVGRELLDRTIAAVTREGLKSLIEKQTERLTDELLERLGDD